MRIVGILITLVIISLPYILVRKPVYEEFKEPAKESSSNSGGYDLSFFGKVQQPPRLVGYKYEVKKADSRLRMLRGGLAPALPLYHPRLVVLAPILIIGVLLIYTLRDKKK